MRLRRVERRADVQRRPERAIDLLLDAALAQAKVRRRPGAVADAFERMGWACWKTYVSRPEADTARKLAMTVLGNGLSAAKRHKDALPVKEAELSM